MNKKTYFLSILIAQNIKLQFSSILRKIGMKVKITSSFHALEHDFRNVFRSSSLQKLILVQKRVGLANYKH